MVEPAVKEEIKKEVKEEVKQEPVQLGLSVIWVDRNAFNAENNHYTEVLANSSEFHLSRFFRIQSFEEAVSWGCFDTQRKPDYFPELSQKAS